MFRNVKKQPKGTADEKRISRRIAMLFVLIPVTMTVFSVYRFLLGRMYFEITLAVYMILATAFILAYVIYNRGMSRRGLREEMLPSQWSDEEKKCFLADGERRLRRSRWMLIPIFAFLFTFAFDILELFVLPFFKGLFF
ncbi:MAG: hypothetical protein IJY47_04470 [Clostridia bacterium]|nr:hypothetical protein [Clostridia bacterium]